MTRIVIPTTPKAMSTFCQVVIFPLNAVEDSRSVEMQEKFGH